VDASEPDSDVQFVPDTPAPKDVTIDVPKDTDAPPPDPGPTDVGQQPEPPGAWTNPIVVGPLPWSHSADMTEVTQSIANSYAPCAPQTNESGPEVVYVLTLDQATAITVSVDDVPGDSVDIDVHLLTSPASDACVARHNTSFTQALEAGTYWIAADTWVNADGVSQPGPYTLTVAVAAEPDPDPASCLEPVTTCKDGETPVPSGVPVEPPGIGGCPAGMLAVEDFCVDRYEAMLVMIKSDGTLAPWSPFLTPGDTPVMALSVPSVVPQGHINQVQATAACDNAGKRLCTNAEWLRACQGPGKTTFPYGSMLQPKVCNDSRECHPVVQYFGTGADWIWSKLNHPCINQQPDSVALTGANAGCVTSELAYDMMGNLHEWTADQTGTFRGGFYADTKINGPGCLYATTAHNVYHWDYSTGFRCCADL